MFCFGCMFTFVVFEFSFSVLSHEIGCEERLRSNLFSVGWDVQPYLSQCASASGEDNN